MKRHAAVFGVLLIALTGALAGMPAHAANPDFQDFFFDVCVNPTGALAARCGETPFGGGDLSGDSESSLNPSQALSGTDAALSEARARSKEARERVDQYQHDEDTAGPRVSLGPLSLLIHGRREWEQRNREVDVDAERGYEADRWAMEVGLDRRFSDQFVAGLIYGYENGDLEFDRDRAGENFTPAADAGTIDREAHSVTVFGVLSLSDQAYVEANAGYAWSDYTVVRRAVFQESTRSVAQTNAATRGDTNGNQAWLGVTAGYEWNRGAASFGVYAGTTYVESRLDGYRESDPGNSGLGLVVDDVKRDALTSHVGFRAQRAIGTSYAVWLPQIRVEYEHTGGTDDARAQVRYALDGNATTLALTGDDSDDDAFNVGVGVAAVFPNGWVSFADVEAMAGAEERKQYRLTVGIRKEL